MNKMNKKRVIPVLLSLALALGLAACTGAAQTQPASAAGKSVASSPTSFDTPSSSGTGSSAAADSVLPAGSSGTDQTVNATAAPAAASAPAVQSTQVKGTSFQGAANNGNIKTVSVKSSSSCPYSSAPAFVPSSASAGNAAGITASCKNGTRIVISGGSIPCSPYFCGTSICEVIRCAPSSCQSTSCKSSSCKSSSSSKLSASSKPSTSSKPSSSSKSSAPSGTSSSQSSFAQQVFQLVNAERAKNGLKALTLNTNVAKAAQLRANEISTQFSHTRPNGQDPFTALKAYGVSYSAAGENIAYGQRTPQEVMTGWMNSPGHRANILNSSFTQIGIGVYKNASGVYYWTQEFIG